MSIQGNRLWMASGLLLAGVAALFPPSASAQVERSVGEVVRSFRSGPQNHHIAYILSQRVPGFTGADRDALADSLLRIALEESPVLSSEAMVELTLAGHPGWALRAPYPGSHPRLKSILDQATDTLVKLSAFRAILDVVKSPQSEYDMIREWVTLPGVPGALAFSALADRGEEGSIVFRPEIRPILRRVIESEELRSRMARIRAEAVARANGWRMGGG